VISTAPEGASQSRGLRVGNPSLRLPVEGNLRVPNRPIRSVGEYRLAGFSGTLEICPLGLESGEQRNPRRNLVIRLGLARFTEPCALIVEGTSLPGGLGTAQKRIEG